MAYYSKTGIAWNFLFPNIKLIKSSGCQTNPINYYWNLRDALVHKIQIDNCLDQEQILRLVNCPKSRLHIDFDAEPILCEEIELLNRFLTKNKIDCKKVFVYVQDYLQKKHFYEVCKANLIVTYRHYVKQKTDIQKIDLENKRFSCFVRRHTPQRYYICKQLYDTKILKNAHWSYLGRDNEINEMADIPKTDKFSRKLPKKLKSIDNGLYEQSSFLYQAIFSSQIHILIETVYSLCELTHENIKLPVDVSEKTFKAVICKKPFVVFGIPNWLEGFRTLGFKTFSPFIDESYDTEEDNDKRLCLIVKELERLNRLPQTQIDRIEVECRDIVEHNYAVWKKVYDQYAHKKFC